MLNNYEETTFGIVYISPISGNQMNMYRTDFQTENPEADNPSDWSLDFTSMTVGIILGEEAGFFKVFSDTKSGIFWVWI